MPTLADLLRMKQNQDLVSIPRPEIDNQLASLIEGGGNFIRNDQTGQVIDLGQSSPQPRYTGTPVDVFGQGKGYLDPSSGMIRGVNQAGQNFRVQPEGTNDAKIKARTDAEDRAMKIAEFNAKMNPANNQQKAPSGYRFTADGSLEPITGGPADIKAQMLAQQKGQASEQAALSSQQVLDQAAMLLQHPGRQTATGASYFMGNIPGTDAKGFQSQLETFKAQTFIPMVSALKGMGALSDAEGKKLAASVGALDPSMKEEEFKSSLESVINYLYAKGKASGLNVSNPLGQTAQQSSGGVTRQSQQSYDADKEARYNAWKAQQGR